MRYKLPEALGGGEFDDAGDWTIGTVAFRFDGIEGLVYLPRALLTEVRPPLPEEPPVGTVVRALLPDEDEQWVFERLGRRTDGKDWGAAGRDEAFAWADLNVRATPVVLVPDPFAEPVALPWSKHLDQSVINVLDSNGKVLVETISGGRAMLQVLAPSFRAIQLGPNVVDGRPTCHQCDRSRTRRMEGRPS
jgi:hypothetical protein